MNFNILIEKRRLKDLKPAEYNPRADLQPGDPDYENIADSLDTFGYVETIVVNKDGTIIGGHQRYNVLMNELGEDAKIDVSVVDLSKEDEKRLNLKLNKAVGRWDDERLKDLLIDLSGSDDGIEHTGFSDEELANLVVKIDGLSNVHEDDFDIDSVSEDEIVAKEGQIWQLGDHRLICGDSTTSDVYFELMDGRQANLVLTDPPYNVDYEGSAGKIKNDNMSNDKFYDFLMDSFENMYSVMDDQASIYVFHADTEGLNFRKAFQDAGFYLSGCCIWEKQSLVMGRSPYQWQHEPILFGWKKDGIHKWYGGRSQSTIWKFDRPQKNDLHPTMKPIDLCANAIANSSMANCIVLDPFGGSGSTMIACEEMGRICYMIELDPHYCDVIIARWEAFTDKKAVLLNG